MKDHPTGAGRSSFDLVETRKLFDALDLHSDSSFLDVACGNGRYALEAARYVTAGGAIYAVDLWEEGIAALRSAARARGIDYIQPKVADVSEHIPVGDREIDTCLMATVLHDLAQDGTHDATLQELRRVLKLGGRLAVVEFKKQDGPPGPPREVRLSPSHVEALLRPHAFDLMRVLETGLHTYLSMFCLAGS